MTYNRLNRLFLLLSILTIFDGCTTSKHTYSINSQLGKIHQEEFYVIKNVNIIPMTIENKSIENATVVIKNKKILSINEPIPDKAKIIDGRNKWLIPGLIDMHVHNLADISFSTYYPTKGATLFVDTQDFMLLYIANGVTTTFELNARAEHFGQRNEITKGNVIGPRVALAYLINGGNTPGNIANTPSDGRQTVRIAKAQGYEFIKVYSHLNIDTYKAIVDEAGKQGMKVLGHIPNTFRGKLNEAFVPHFDMVVHAEEYSKHSKDLSYREAQNFAQLAKQNGTWLTPTLTTMEWIANQTNSLDGIRNLPSLKYVHPLLQNKWIYSNRYNQETDQKHITRINNMTSFHLQLVKAFKEVGVPIVAGTDAGVSGLVWGFSLHDELELLVKAGLTTKEALASATRLPATWLGIENIVGTVETGKYADLILLDDNPLDNISNTRKISGVFVDGKWIEKRQIEAMLSDLAKRNSANKDKYDWNRRTEY